MNKELEALNNLNCGNAVYVHKDYWNEIQKKLKALEIIKKGLEYFIDYDESTKTIYIDGAIDCDNKEYDLLKEVLL
ncbi:MAG: hypothetical protein K5765_06640 [Clostridia bacterium]|nr:hypothetical protein [Clostridia bacterium]